MVGIGFCLNCHIRIFGDEISGVDYISVSEGLICKDCYNTKEEDDMYGQFKPELKEQPFERFIEDFGKELKAHQELNINNIGLTSHLIQFNGKNGEEILKLDNNGDIYVHGELVENDKKVVDGMREFLAIYGIRGW